MQISSQRNLAVLVAASSSSCLGILFKLKFMYPIISSLSSQQKCLEGTKVVSSQSARMKSLARND